MKKLTQRQARKAYVEVCRRLHEKPHAEPYYEQSATGGHWPAGPVLVRDFESWHSTHRWAVVWEGGPFEWTLDVVEERLEQPDLLAEPINSYALGLYHDGRG